MRFVENNRWTLLNELRRILVDADEALFAVAYIRTSGVRLLQRSLESVRQRHGTIRILFALQPPISDSAALRALLDLGANVRCYVAPHVFHAKGYIVQSAQQASAIVGSANLSGSALTQGREWCLIGTADELPIDELHAEFERLWDSPYASEVTEQHLQWLEQQTCSDELRAIAANEDQIAPTRPPEYVDDNANYVVRRREDDASYWWFQIYERPLARHAALGRPFNVVVICDLDANTERRFVIPYEYLLAHVLPQARRDERRRRYLFEIDKGSLEFRWTGGFRFDGRPFLA